MERKLHLSRGPRAATILATALLGAAALWDVLRLARVGVSPGVSYVLMGVAVAAACVGVLLRVLARPPAFRRNLIELVVAGLVLLAWWLRGESGVPADPPLVAVEIVATLVLGSSAWFGERSSQRSTPN